MKNDLLKLLCLVTAVLISAGCQSLGLGGGGGGGGNVTSVCQKPSDTTFVSLSKQGGSTSFIFNGDASDPLAFCETKHARISKVTNNSGYNMSLAHGGPGSQFVILDQGMSSTAWNGGLVEGNWSAQYSGDINRSPSQMTIEVEWTRP